MLAVGVEIVQAPAAVGTLMGGQPVQAAFDRLLRSLCPTGFLDGALPDFDGAQDERRRSDLLFNARLMIATGGCARQPFGQGVESWRPIKRCSLGNACAGRLLARQTRYRRFFR